jgi:hypothetical protein
MLANPLVVMIDEEVPVIDEEVPRPGLPIGPKRGP